MPQPKRTTTLRTFFSLIIHTVYSPYIFPPSHSPSVVLWSIPLYFSCKKKKNHFKIFFFSFSPSFLMSFSFCFFIYSTAFPTVLYQLYLFLNIHINLLHICLFIFAFLFLFLNFFPSPPFLFCLPSPLCLFSFSLYSFTLSFFTK